MLVQVQPLSLLPAKLRSQAMGTRALESLLVLMLYFAAGRAGLAAPFLTGNLAPVWPAAGIALGSILIFGRHVWLGVAAGSLLVDFFSPVPKGAALIVAFGNTAAPLLAAALLRHRGFTRIRRLTDLIHLVTHGSLGFVLSGLIGPTALYLTGVHSWNNLPARCLVWWLGDCLGLLLITPLMVNFAEFRTLRPRLPEFFLLLAWLFTGTAVLIQQRVITETAFALALLPFIIWAAVRFSVAGAALASCLVAIITVWETAHGARPFISGGSPLYNASILQTFIGVLSLSGLCLAAVIADRTTIEAALSREEKLRATQEQYQMIIETTNEGVWMLNHQYRTTYVNRQIAEMLGYKPEEMIGRPLFDFLFPEDFRRKEQDLELRRRGVRQVLYNRCRKKDGTEMWALVSTTPLFATNKEFLGVLAMITDVTLLRKTEETFRRNEKLITAGRMAATISHEVNNPLEAVVNLLYLLKVQPMSHQAKEYLALVEKEVQRISAVTRRTLGFFRDNSTWVELSVADLLEDTLTFYEQRLNDHSIDIVRAYGEGGIVSASRSELQQVFANLLSNALDAMSGGGTLTLRVSWDADNAGTLIIVEDTGTGIPAEHLQYIFEPFFTTKENTGTGLGLWVAKEIIQKHGGTLTVSSKSAPGDAHGTRFAIFLPRNLDQRAAA